MQTRCVVLLLLLLAHLAGAEELLFEKKGPFGTVLVTQDGSLRALKFKRPEGAIEQSRLDLRRPEYLSYEYTRKQLLGLVFVPRPRKVLVVGLGGASLTRALAHLLPEARIDSLEIDPVVVEAARQFFLYQEGPRLRTFVDDARQHLEKSTEVYDLILLDAFDGLDVPEHLRTLEFYQLLRQRLAPGGAVVANLHLRSPLYASDRNTLAGAFPQTYGFQSAAQRVVVGHNAEQALSRESLLERAGELVTEYPLLDYCRGLEESRDWDLDAPVLTDGP
ncbi:MAG: fused MFS/spermidine synthase [Candidatus Eremiobacteraeota bacterium]|nr:fused MFS/spermidine synthase [Candidatus Eremiobacteraeota bacterium]